MPDPNCRFCEGAGGKWFMGYWVPCGCGMGMDPPTVTMGADHVLFDPIPLNLVPKTTRRNALIVMQESDHA